MNGRSTRPGWDIGEGGPGGWSSRKVLIGIREEERLTTNSGPKGTCMLL